MHQHRRLAEAMNNPNPDQTAYQASIRDESYRAHERFLARFGPQIQPHRPMRPLGGKLIVGRIEGNDTFWNVEGES